MAELIEGRRNSSALRLNALQQELTAADSLAQGKACVIVTGSYGRGEASAHSDLDLVIVGKTAGKRRILSRLDEICIESDLIRAVRKLEFPDFDSDGEYLKHYMVKELVEHLGTEQDDVTNALTTRLLLLLESRPLLGAETYQETIRHILDAYWKEYEGHKNDFRPAFLANDILRLWRTFCVNYEARTSPEPPEKKAKRKLKNYKLKHSRLLTCYSGLAFMLATFVELKTMSVDDAMEMVTASPTGRLQKISERKRFAACRPATDRLLERYEAFLSETDMSESELIEKFKNREESARLTIDMHQFGDLMWDLLREIGDGNPMLRMLIV